MVPHGGGAPARSSELPLLGLSKDRPSVVLLVRESTPGRRTPGCPGARPPSGRSCQLPPCSDPVVSHHLAGFLLPAGTRVLQRVSDPGVHPRFHRCRPIRAPLRARLPDATWLSRDAFLPSEAFPPCTAASSVPCETSPAGNRHRLDSHLPRRSPTSLPSRCLPPLPLMRSRLLILENLGPASRPSSVPGSVVSEVVADRR